MPAMSCAASLMRPRRALPREPPCAAFMLRRAAQRSECSMSHHYSGPDFGFPHGDARLDLTDLYAFPKPGGADSSILIRNVHPPAFVNPQGSPPREPFAPEALYEIKIDTNDDAVADIAYRVRFSPSADGPQTATVRRVEGAQAAETGDSGQVLIEAAPVSTGRDARVTEAGRYRFFAGWRSDPFFFDRRVAGTLLPDILSYAPSRPASFPGNGRTLTDDAADAFLAVLTNGQVTGDKVGPHVDLLTEFPYLGPPHKG